MNNRNKRTGITASALGVLLGLAGIFNHGIFEILQGNTSTNGFFIEAIGEANRYWTHGTEAAFTIIHNFLVTGICVIVTGVSIIIWSLKYLQAKNGATVFILLLILSTLVGGGIGHIIVFLPVWAFTTLINKPLHWWEKVLPVRLRNKLSALWIYSLVVTTMSWLIVMELGIFGYFPGKTDPDIILNIVFVFLFSTAILACITFICAISGDIQNRNHDDVSSEYK